MSETTRPPLLLPILIITAGVGLLLTNFLLIDGIDLLRFWPVALIGAGGLALLRGDFAFSKQAQTFGITRGNVQSAQLEASAGELDVKIRALQREGRLIAGTYTARSRPVLGVRGTHAALVLQRGQTWLLSMADWEIGIAPDLPWSVLASTHLGAIDANLEGLTIERAYLGTGLGDLRLVAPAICPNGIFARSTFGDVIFELPRGLDVVINVRGGPFARIQIDESRFILLEPGIYATLNYQNSAAPQHVILQTTFGTIRVG